MRCLTVISGPRRYDVIVDEQLLVEEVLALVLPGGDVLAMTMAGEPLALDRSVVDSRLETGSMILTTSARTAVTPPRVRSAVTELSADGGGASGSAALSNAGSRSVLVAAASTGAAPTGAASTGAASTGAGPTGGSSRSQMTGPSPASTTNAAGPVRRRSGRMTDQPTAANSLGASRNGLLLVAMVLSALAVLAFSRAQAERSAFGLASGLLLVVCGLSISQMPAADRLARLVAPVLGVAGGAVGLGAYTHGPHLAVIGGCAAGSLVTLGGRATDGPERNVPRVWLTFLAGVGALTLLALAAGASMVSVAVLLLAIATLVARIVPDLVLDVADDVLLDIDRLSATSWSPREARRRLRRSWRIDDGGVRSLVVAAAVEQLATLIGLAVVVVGSSVVAVGEVLARPSWPLQLLLLAAAAALSLTARAYRRRRERLILRWTAVAPLLAVAVPWLGRLSESGSAVVATVLLVLFGLALAGLSGAVGKGYRSLWGARLADLVELLALVAVLPLALWSAGLVEWATSLLA
jgi:hypothetical protein